MQNISKVGKECVGCRSCEQICPKHCIKMKQNKEGFLYPEVIQDSCISCGVCLKKCPALKESYTQNKVMEVYALKAKDKKCVFNSASGGAADVATKVILQKGGYVYGAVYNKSNEVNHIEVIDNEGRKKLQSSKYVQSNINNCYLLAEKRLNEGKYVLFTGTPCQIAGLYSFLGQEYDHLFTIDLICHGVPSPLFFKKYLAYQEKVLGEEILYYNFRSKQKRGWGTQYLIKTKTKTKTKTLSLDKFGNHFMKGDCYRESCYNCKYANIIRTGDLTIGDFWGIDKCKPEFSSALGVSSVLVNNDKGKKLLSFMKDEIEIIPCSLDEALIKQGNLIRPTSRPNERNHFYDRIQENDFIESIRVGIQIKERIKAIIPGKIVKILKRYV